MKEPHWQVPLTVPHTLAWISIVSLLLSLSLHPDYRVQVYVLLSHPLYQPYTPSAWYDTIPLPSSARPTHTYPPYRYTPGIRFAVRLMLITFYTPPPHPPLILLPLWLCVISLLILTHLPFSDSDLFFLSFPLPCLYILPHSPSSNRAAIYYCLVLIPFAIPQLPSPSIVKTCFFCLVFSFFTFTFDAVWPVTLFSTTVCWRTFLPEIQQYRIPYIHDVSFSCLFCMICCGLVGVVRGGGWESVGMIFLMLTWVLGVCMVDGGGVSDTVFCLKMRPWWYQRIDGIGWFKLNLVRIIVGRVPVTANGRIEWVSTGRQRHSSRRAFNYK